MVSEPAPERVWISPDSAQNAKRMGCWWREPTLELVTWLLLRANPDAQARHAADERIAALTEALLVADRLAGELINLNSIYHGRDRLLLINEYHQKRNAAMLFAPAHAAIEDKP